jgi:hypothetical protein
MLWRALVHPQVVLDLLSWLELTAGGAETNNRFWPQLIIFGESHSSSDPVSPLELQS